MFWRMSSATSVLVCLALCATAPAGSAGQFAFEKLTPARRRTIDARALRVPERNGRAELQLEFYGDAAGWLVSRTPLPDEEEVRRAAEAHRQIVREARISATPRAAEDVLAELLGELPGRMRRPGFLISLTVLDEPGREAFTVGAGRIYIPRDYLEALLSDREHGRSRLAFVLAHELGHVCRRHTRRTYQLLWLQEHIKDDVNRKAESKRLRKLLDWSVDTTGKWLKLLYTDRQEFKADLFALALCRNAGFDVEVCLDALRERIVAFDGELLGKDDRAGKGLTAREKSPASSDGTDWSEAPRTTDLSWRRLKRLRAELDGIVSTDEYGLFELDPATGAITGLDESLPRRKERIVVFVHGMDSDAKVFGPLARQLGDELRVRMLAFRYPNDGSLARSGRFLSREIRRRIPWPEQIDFVCHSAGGLVFRWYAEVEGGPFRTALLMGTPNGGTVLARLRALMEAKQLVGDLKLGYSKALERVILDAKGQIAFDLQTDSLFLRFLNRQRSGNRSRWSRYAVIRGRALKRRHALLARASAAAGRVALRMTVKKWEGTPILRAEAEKWVERLGVPPEVSRGDLAVTLKSATLEGVSTVRTFRANHVSMPKDAEVTEAVEEWLTDSGGDR